MLSHLVSVILLSHRSGIHELELIQETDRLRLEILKRGGQVLDTQGKTLALIVVQALHVLQELVVVSSESLVVPSTGRVRCLGAMLRCSFDGQSVAVSSRRNKSQFG